MSRPREKKEELRFKEVPPDQVREFWQKLSSAIRPKIEEDDRQRTAAKAKEMTIAIGY